VNHRLDKLTLDGNALNAPTRPSAQLADAVDDHLRGQVETEMRLRAFLIRCWRKTTRALRNSGVNTRPHSALSARLALKALQEKVKTDGKLRPWLVHMVWRVYKACGVWYRSAQLGKMSGSRTAQRLGALEVSRLDTVRRFLGTDG
jgi:chromosome segregation protein